LILTNFLYSIIFNIFTARKKRFMKQSILFAILFTTVLNLVGQNVGLGTNSPHSSALLDVSSTTKGALLPRMTTVQRTAIATPAKGLIVFDTDSNSFWYYNGSAWINMAAGGGAGSPSDWVSSGDKTYLSNLSGLVGIGTTNPTSPLTINYPGSVPGIIVKATGSWSTIDIDASNYHDAAIRLLKDGSSAWVLRRKSFSDDFEIVEVGGDSRMFFEANTGRVGIGTTTPSAKLHVGYTGGSSGIAVKSSQSYATIDVDSYDGEAALRFYHQGTGTWNVRNQAGTDNFQINELNGGGTRFVIENATGNIGIGTADPAEKLDVTGNAKISGAVTVGGDGIVKSADATQMKMTRSAILLGFGGLGAGGTATSGYFYWTESFNSVAIYVGNVQSATATGEWYKVMLTPFEIDTVNKRCRFHITNVANTVVTFNANWEVLLVGN
jgi:hypothetical protein